MYRSYFKNKIGNQNAIFSHFAMCFHLMIAELGNEEVKAGMILVLI